MMNSTQLIKNGSLNFQAIDQQLKELHIFDLQAIEASFSQFLQNEKDNPVLLLQIQNRLSSVQGHLKDIQKELREFSPIPITYRPCTVQYNDYEELEEIGHGVSAEVHKGRHKITGELVAIKKFKFQKLNSNKIQVYQREVAALAKATHPTLIKLIGVTDTQPFCILTEWMNGGSLFHALKKKSLLSPTDRSIAAFDIARGLHFLHSQHIVHRDMKSLNILLDGDHRIRICDFGFARFADEDTRMTSSVGTPCTLR